MSFTKALILSLFFMDPGIDHFCFSSNCRDQSVEVEQEAETREIVIAENGGVYLRDRRVDVEPFNFVPEVCALRSNFKQVIIIGQVGFSRNAEHRFELWEKLFKKAATSEHCAEPLRFQIHSPFSAHMFCDHQKIFIAIQAGKCSCDRAQEIIDSLTNAPLKDR